MASKTSALTAHYRNTIRRYPTFIKVDRRIRTIRAAGLRLPQYRKFITKTKKGMFYSIVFIKPIFSGLKVPYRSVRQRLYYEI